MLSERRTMRGSQQDTPSWPRVISFIRLRSGASTCWPS
ncbi:hypothetical protein trd_0628 [Thermomicrobium roseum DSM 5159]|uniref:Uncharacterized protein n=1 Tax=Thermomicrobium roseum (strain ATCC 27502 / DSM 5159 / P-2) TaxID=309801 RepID=B9KYS4_THERP|nr:hypothetical protein trd_0628 [Thermomicrobium roseum DSM 5159]